MGALPIITATFAEGESFEMFVPIVEAVDGSEGESMAVTDWVTFAEVAEGEDAEMFVLLYWEDLAAAEWADLTLRSYRRILY